MQTFLPYPDFAASAATLDARRLGKQRVEALQVLRGLTVPGYGWRHHPAVRMWTGYEEALVRYGLEMCRVWTATGRADTCAASLLTGFAAHRDDPGVRTREPGAHTADPAVRTQEQLTADHEVPPWLGDPAFHRSHRSALRSKAPDVYAPLFPDDPDGLPYVWPPSDRSG
ncbi:MSMEG_6728 family protein [Streptomyces sp. cmx-18-6]|uniref:MSMEG_6728 family protein n=1 Tax=Streptomyces sp. cmx-18-6 TaxID=2790930 RepID=UPI00397ED76A